MTIEKLTSEIINQIAAGEVIENPSAVIKELVENSIDANSTEINIEIENSGFDKIVIKDNGSGISKSDLLKAPLRHATSKIKDFNDLYSIKTMGFRGEALASIFSVANTRLVSKVENSEEAYEILSTDLEIVKQSARTVGTTIIVDNLFYNVPARRKYLKSENLELKAIVDVVMRFAIAHFDKKITLKHNGKFLINKPEFKTKEDNIIYLLGRELKGELMEINYLNNGTVTNHSVPSCEGIKITGFIGKPSSITYSYSKNQYIFVNQRFIKSKLIKDAVLSGFGTNLMEARHPMFVLFIDIDPEIIDVNVHPSKIEIRFENELEIFEFVKKSIKEVFEKNSSFKEFENKKIETDKKIDIEIAPKISLEKPKIKEYYSNDVQKTFDVKEDIVNYEMKVPKEEVSVENIDIEEQGKKERENIISYGPLYEILSEYRIVGTMHKTYVIIETKNEMMIIDFHAAEEKTKYESFVDMIENSNVKTQTLLKPQVIHLDTSEKLLFDEHKNLFKKFGFEIEEFGENSIIVRSVPIDIRGVAMNPLIVQDIIGEISIDKKFINLEHDKLDKLASRACRSSIKAGYEMTLPEIKNLIESLKKLKEPFNCPHGRPVILKWDWYDLDKKFKRIV